MSDTISRQAAIRWIKAECNPYGKPTLDYETSCRIMEHLDRMPSAEKAQLSGEDATKDATSDLISKKEATTIPVMPKEHREYQTMNLDDAYEQGWFDCQKCIEELPSAEPKTPSNGSITSINPENTHDRTMGDSISREDACEAVKNEMESWLEGDRCDYRNVVDAIMDLPSAEKAQLSEEDATSDLISRKALLKQIDIDSDGERGYYGDNWKFIDTIEAMPSAEPKIIKCENCKYIQKWRSEESAKKFGQIYECARGVLVCPKPDDFCSKAERRGDSK